MDHLLTLINHIAAAMLWLNSREAQTVFIEILRWSFTGSMTACIIRLSIPAGRALTKHIRPLDPIWCLIFNFILSRLYFTWRGAYYSVIDRPFEGTSLIIGYIWGIILYVVLLIIYKWYDDA